MQLTELLSISGPEGLCDPPGPAPTPTPKPVSCSLGGRDPNSTLLYPILFPVGVTAGETVPIVPGTIDGVQIINTVRNQVSKLLCNNSNTTKQDINTLLAVWVEIVLNLKKISALEL